MKCKTLRNRTEALLEGAQNYKEMYETGLQCIAAGEMIRRMAEQMELLQQKVDRQQETLRRYEGGK